MDQNSGCLPVLLVIGIGLWFAFGHPARTVADWYWPNDAAPWESVDAFYYPNKADLGTVREQHGLADVQSCRDWVNAQAYADGDPTMTRSDYECGLGEPEPYGILKIYRATVD